MCSWCPSRLYRLKPGTDIENGEHAMSTDRAIQRIMDGTIGVPPPRSWFRSFRGLVIFIPYRPRSAAFQGPLVLLNSDAGDTRQDLARVARASVPCA